MHHASQSCSNAQSACVGVREHVTKINMRATSKSAESRAPLEVTPDDLEAALELLRGEEASQMDPRPLVWQLLRNLAVGVTVMTLPLGLWSVFFDREWGLGLLAVAVVAFFSIALMPNTDLGQATRTIRSTVDAQTVSAALTLRE